MQKFEYEELIWKIETYHVVLEFNTKMWSIGGLKLE